jgi:hypothetical protein
MNHRHALFAALVGASVIAPAAPAFARPAPMTPWIVLEGSADARTAAPALGSLVLFDTGYPSNVKNPRIEVLCYQDGQLVYGETASANEAAQQELTGSPGLTLGGGGSIWLTNGGEADCVANLFYFGSKAGQQTYNWLAKTEFTATG